MLKRKSKIHEQIAESKAKDLRNVADGTFLIQIEQLSNSHPARKHFVETYMQNTLNHISTLGKTAEMNKKRFEDGIRQELLDKKISNLESEWDSRKDELQTARQELALREKQRLER